MKYVDSSVKYHSLTGKYYHDYKVAVREYANDISPSFDKDDQKWIITTAISMVKPGHDLTDEHILVACDLLEVGLRRAFIYQARKELVDYADELLEKQKKGEPLDD